MRDVKETCRMWPGEKRVIPVVEEKNFYGLLG
jgi:hypothetical protein